MLLKKCNAVSSFLQGLSFGGLILATTLSCSGSPAVQLRDIEQEAPPSFITKTDDKHFRWQLPFQGTVWLEGPIVVDGDTLSFQPDTAHGFWNWHDGWTELDFVVEGELIFQREDHHWVYRGDGTPALIDISQAAIRYRNTILRGEEARREALNRQNRLKAFTKLLRDEMPASSISTQQPALFKNLKHFKKIVGKRWFPEAMGHDEGWKDFNFNDKGYIRSHGISWSVSATETLLPEELHELRTSGTLFRDYEEGLEWLYLEWLWDYYFSSDAGLRSFEETVNNSFTMEDK